MRRQPEETFAPLVQLGEADGGGQLPPPGPTGAWSARGVIDALEPLVVSARLTRLREVLAARVESVTVALDNPHDPHNGSAVLRSCDAFGVARMHILREREDFLASPRVALGSERWVDVVQHTTPGALLSALRAGGFRVVVTHPAGRLAIDELAGVGRLALVLGNERDGVGPELTAGADASVAIPMRGFVESLNLSVSAAILLQAATRSRPGDLPPAHSENLYARWLRRTVPQADRVLDALEAR